MVITCLRLPGRGSTPSRRSCAATPRRFGESACALLREDQLSVGDDVVLTLLPRDGLRFVRSALVQLGRETRSPAVIAVSDRAVEDLDPRHLMRRYTERNVWRYARGDVFSCVANCARIVTLES